MQEQYSAQQLNSHLPEASEYQRLIGSKSTFWSLLQEFYSNNDLEELEIEEDVFTDVRDRSPGREVNF